MEARDRISFTSTTSDKIILFLVIDVKDIFWKNIHLYWSALIGKLKSQIFVKGQCLIKFQYLNYYDISLSSFISNQGSQKEGKGSRDQNRIFLFFFLQCLKIYIWVLGHLHSWLPVVSPVVEFFVFSPSNKRQQRKKCSLQIYENH